MTKIGVDDGQTNDKWHLNLGFPHHPHDELRVQVGTLTGQYTLHPFHPYIMWKNGHMKRLNKK